MIGGPVQILYALFTPSFAVKECLQYLCYKLHAGACILLREGSPKLPGRVSLPNYQGGLMQAFFPC